MNLQSFQLSCSLRKMLVRQDLLQPQFFVWKIHESDAKAVIRICSFDFTCSLKNNFISLSSYHKNSKYWDKLVQAISAVRKKLSDWAYSVCRSICILWTQKKLHCEISCSFFRMATVVTVDLQYIIRTLMARLP